MIYVKCNNKGHYEHNPNRLFSHEFVENNKDNIILKINGKESKLIVKYDLKNGVNNIKINIIINLTSLEKMLYEACSLKRIEELKYLNAKEVNNFSEMFYGCSSLSDIKPLQNWNVSNGNNFSKMFGWCLSLSDIKPLQNWNISKNKLNDIFKDI